MEDCLCDPMGLCRAGVCFVIGCSGVSLLDIHPTRISSDNLKITRFLRC